MLSIIKDSFQEIYSYFSCPQEESGDFYGYSKPVLVALSGIAIAGMYSYYSLGNRKPLVYSSLDLKPHWTIGFEKQDGLGVKEKIQKVSSYLVGRSNLSDEEVEGFNPRKKTSQYDHLGWDEGKVAKVGDDKLLFTTGLSVCIAVLARGYKLGEGKPSYLAVHHYTLNLNKLSKTLVDLINKVGIGTIEVFLSGGEKASSGKDYERINSLMKKLSSRWCPIEVKDDTFGIADVDSGVVKVTKKHTYNCGTPTLHKVGFDLSLNPVQIIGVSDIEPEVLVEKAIWVGSLTKALDSEKVVDYPSKSLKNDWSIGLDLKEESLSKENFSELEGCLGGKLSLNAEEVEKLDLFMRIKGNAGKIRSIFLMPGRWSINDVQDNRLPYTEICEGQIPILIRAYNSGESKPSYLAMHLFVIDLDLLKEGFLELMEKVEGGRIEVFLSPGKDTELESYTTVKSAIENLGTDACRLEIKDEISNIDNLGCVHKIGFDPNLNPVQIIRPENS